MRYSWKAVTCCVSKGMLCIAAGVGVLILVLAIENAAKQSAEAAASAAAEANAQRCATFRDQYMASPAGSPEEESALRRYRDCMGFTDRSQIDRAQAVFGAFLASLVALCILVGICGQQISYCQVAVDTGRRPWYWIPRIGNRLPPREMVPDCESCGSQRLETEAEYRSRLGLEPLS